MSSAFSVNDDVVSTSHRRLSTHDVVSTSHRRLSTHDVDSTSHRRLSTHDVDSTLFAPGTVMMEDDSSKYHNDEMDTAEKKRRSRSFDSGNWSSNNANNKKEDDDAGYDDDRLRGNSEKKNLADSSSAPSPPHSHFDDNNECNPYCVTCECNRDATASPKDENENGDGQETTTSNSLLKSLSIVGLVLLLGLIEGYLFAHTGLFAPATFVGQMRFETFILLKVFVSAVGTSMLAQAFMAVFGNEQFEKSRAYRQDNNGWLKVIGGCLLLGIGMAVSGSGPTMLPTQLGSGMETSGMILIGYLVGGAIYALLEKFGIIGLDRSRKSTDVIVVEELLPDAVIYKFESSCTRLTPYQLLAIPMGIFMMGFAFLVDWLSPHSAEAAQLGLPPYALGSDSTGFARTIQEIFFHPVTAGMIVGINQIPLRYIQDDGQGGSTTIMNIIALISWGHLSPRHFIRSWKQATQIIYVYGGTLIGGLIGFIEITQTTHTSASTVRHVALGDSPWSPWRVFIGGVVTVFGARVAGGCTCGHGISGVSELSLQSFAGAAAIFGAGIAITFAIGL